MAKIDFTPRCRNCGAVIPEEDRGKFKPCSVCGFDSMKDLQKKAQEWLSEMIRAQKENDRRIKNMKPGDGPTFAEAVI